MMAHPCSEEQYVSRNGETMIRSRSRRVAQPFHNLVLMYADLFKLEVALDKMYRSSSAQFLNNMECHRMDLLCRLMGNPVL